MKELINEIKIFKKLPTKVKELWIRILIFCYSLLPFCLYPLALKVWYYKQTKRNLNLKKIQTYNDKLQWLKLYNSIPIKTRLADKYAVREWVKEKIGEEYLVALLGVYDKYDDIDFNVLPNQFVIKCNHGSGYNIIVRDKSKLNVKEVKYKLNRWMNENFAFKGGFELHYLPIKPKIIIEEFINPKESHHEIQIWCFNQTIKFVSVESIKDAEELVRGTFYPNGQPTEFEISPNHYKKLIHIGDKRSFYKAIELAEKLIIDVPYVRIDFIEWKGSVKFREMTFTSGSGLSQIKPSTYSQVLGNWIVLPKQAYNFKTGKYYNFPFKQKNS